MPTHLTDNNIEPAKVILWLCLVAYLGVAFFIHSAACNVHIEAVKLYRFYHPHSEKFAWSYAYCSRIGPLARVVLGEP